MMNFKNEEAVSPVIGVILMVAITVILAAVIAAFVFGMTGNVQTTKTVGITASLNNTQHLIVTVQGGGDVNDLASLNMSIDGVANENTTGDVKVGTSFSSSKEIENGNHVVVVAHFKDLSQQVVLDKFY
jgi:flagellin-like protein